jgi:hypothetical protein
MQGYLFSKPIDADALTSLLEDYEPRDLGPAVEPLPLIAPQSATA